MTRRTWGFLVLPLALGLAACGDDASDDAQVDGSGGGACTVEDKGDGTAVIRCADGSEFTVSNGTPGADGKDGAKGEDGKDAQEPPCALSENADGSHTLTCGDTSVVIGAPCPDGFPSDLVVTKEDDVAARSNLLLFQVSSCTWVRGDLRVKEYPGEELPKALARVAKVDGDVLIQQNANLTTASFPALTTVGDRVFFDDNPSLTETSLPVLETVGGDFRWLENAALESVGELPKLTEVGGVFGWGSNPKLERTPDFPELTVVGANLAWINGDALVATGAFPKLKSVGGTLAFQVNAALEDIGDFDALESVGGMAVVSIASLEALPSFPELETIGSSGLQIQNNAALTSIEGLGNLRRIDGFFAVVNNTKLPVCDVYELLTTIKGRDGIGGAENYADNDNTDESCLP